MHAILCILGVNFITNCNFACLNRETKDCFILLSSDPDVRAVVISGRGRIFSAGLDFSMLLHEDLPHDVARRAKALSATLVPLQAALNAIEEVNMCKRFLILIKAVDICGYCGYITDAAY